MALHLITGYAGQEHITANDQGGLQMAMIGEGQFVFDRLNKFSYQQLSNNQIQIKSGEALMQGRFIRLESGTTETVTIDNGTSGKNRNDLIVIRYQKNTSTGVESASFVVIKGTESTGTASDPSYNSGTITDSNAVINDMPLYRVKLIGLNISAINTMFTTQVSLKKYVDNYQTPTASKTAKGVVKVGNNIDVDSDGTISIPTTPTASGTTAGIVKVGSGLNINNGVLSVPSADESTEGIVRLTSMFNTTIGESGPAIEVIDASKSQKGVVKIGSNINVSSGTISVPNATTSAAGVVKVGDGLSISSGTLKVSSNNYIEELWPKSSVTVPAHSYKKVQLKKSYSNVKSAIIAGSIYGVIAQPVFVGEFDLSTGRVSNASVSEAFFINPTGSSVTINPNSIYDEGIGFYINYTK